MKRILVLNMGSTSSKIAYYEDLVQIYKRELAVPASELQGKVKAIQQLDYRTRVVADALKEAGIDLGKLDIIAARGGPMGKISGGAYGINELMLNVLTFAPQSPHESALSDMIAWNLGKDLGIPLIIYDGMTMDEKAPVACRTGRPEIFATTRGHPLNARRVARLAAKEMGIPYEEGNFIVAHFGGSISVCAHKKGRMVDMINANNNGSMSPQRAGRLPTDTLIDLCYSGEYSKQDLYRMINGRSGFIAWCGTQDAREVFARADAGDENARMAIEILVYQVSKNIAEMRIAVGDTVDRIICTGGMSRSQQLVDAVAERVSFIAPVVAYPGEYEMDALAEGALRALQGLEPIKEYTALPVGYQTRDEFYKAFSIPSDAWAIDMALERLN